MTQVATLTLTGYPTAGLGRNYWSGMAQVAAQDHHGISSCPTTTRGRAAIRQPRPRPQRAGRQPSRRSMVSGGLTPIS